MLHKQTTETTSIKPSKVYGQSASHKGSEEMRPEELKKHFEASVKKNHRLLELLAK